MTGRTPGAEDWTLPDAMADADPKDIIIQFQDLLGETITWTGDYREARITSHPTPPALAV